MKKYFGSMMAMLTMAILSINLASCGDDDNGNGANLAYDTNHPIVGSWYTSAMDGSYKNEYLLLLYSNGAYCLKQHIWGGEGYEDFIAEGKYEYDEGEGAIYVTITKTNDPDDEVGRVFELDVLSLSKARLVVGFDDEEENTYIETSYNRVEGKVSF